MNISIHMHDPSVSTQCTLTPVQFLDCPFLHCACILPSLYTFLGIVPSSVVLTGFQVMSRVFLTWAVTHSVREVSLMYYLCIIVVLCLLCSTAMYTKLVTWTDVTGWNMYMIQ